MARAGLLVDKVDASEESLISDFQLEYTHSMLGVGVQGVEWKGKPDGKQHKGALKQIRVNLGHDLDEMAAKKARHWARRAASREVKLLRRAKHRHVVGVIAAYFDPEPAEQATWFCILMPMAQETLGDYLEAGQRLQGMPIKTQWFGCLISALAYVHDVGIWHHDIKPANILVKDASEILLADFGNSRELWQDSSNRERARSARAWAKSRRLKALFSPDDDESPGTTGYLAPETENSKSTAGLPADIFSLGIVFLEMVAAAVDDQDQRTELVQYMKKPLADRNDKGKTIVNVINKFEQSLTPLPSEECGGSAPGSGSAPGRTDSRVSLQCMSDLQILRVSREMVQDDPHLRPIAEDLRQWWRHQMRQQTPAMAQECVCHCNPPNVNGDEVENGRWWRYPIIDHPPNMNIKRAYENGHRLVAKHLLIRGEQMTNDASLLAAARGGLWDLVNQWADSTWAGTVQDDVGRTALHYLARAEDVDDDLWNSVADKLLANKADILTKDIDGCTPLRLAAEKGCLNRIWRLVQSKANHVEGDNSKVVTGSMLVQVLCKGVGGVHDVMVKDADKCRGEIESGLLQCGGGVAQGATGIDAYSQIRAHEPVQVCQLLEADCNGLLEATDDNLQTPLSIAAMHGHEAIVRLLLAQSANFMAKDKSGRDPLSIAAAYGHDGVVSLLLDRYAQDPEALSELQKAKDNRNKNYWQRLLFMAADAGHLAVVKLLLDHDANVAAADVRAATEKSALLTASAHGHQAIVSLLLEDVSIAAGGILAIKHAALNGFEKAREGGHWPASRVLGSYSGQPRSSRQHDRDAPWTPGERVRELWRKCWATLVRMLSKPGTADLGWFVIMVIAGLLAAASMLRGRDWSLHVLPYYHSGLTPDTVQVLGWKLTTNNKTRIPSPAA